MNSNDIIDIADLDCIYLSYDEPQKEEFWLKIKNMVPWAKRVDGVKGSDAAHKAAGAASDTERFILIDGDNMPEESFFNIQLDFTGKDETFKRAQFRWKAINNINGLRYGNGGMSSWTKEYVANMKHMNIKKMAMYHVLLISVWVVMIIYIGLCIIAIAQHFLITHLFKHGVLASVKVLR